MEKIHSCSTVAENAAGLCLSFCPKRLECLFQVKHCSLYFRDSGKMTTTTSRATFQRLYRYAMTGSISLNSWDDHPLSLASHISISDYRRSYTERTGWKVTQRASAWPKHQLQTTLEMQQIIAKGTSPPLIKQLPGMIKQYLGIMRQTRSRARWLGWRRTAC